MYSEKRPPFWATATIPYTISATSFHASKHFHASTCGVPPKKK